MRILIVDDEAPILRSLERHLVRRGHVVRSALAPRDALSALDSFAAEMVITDFKLPEMNGLVLLDLVAARIPDARRVLMSGYADVGAPTEVTFLPKPWTAADLERVVGGAR